MVEGLRGTVGTGEGCERRKTQGKNGLTCYASTFMLDRCCCLEDNVPAQASVSVYDELLVLSGIRI